MNKDRKNGCLSILVSLFTARLLPWLVAAVALFVAGGLAAYLLLGGTRMTIAEEGDTRLTPTQIRSIENIGEWEFLSVADEELVDTVRHGFFSDDELVRIYYGTLRIGIDLHKVSDNWLQPHGDSVHVTLPPVCLLDSNFIDEARTLPVFESGKWSNADRETLYQKARRAMLRRCLTPEHLKQAGDMAEEQISGLMRTLGFAKVGVTLTKNDENSRKAK